MKRLHYCLGPWMAMTAVAYGQARSADVLYTYFGDAPVHGYRVGDECFVPVEDVSKWGWQVTVKGDQADITAEGASFTMGVRTISGHTSLPMRAMMTKIGGVADWITNTDSLQVVSELTSVKYESGKMRVVSPLQIKAKAVALSNPDRVMIDYIGAKLGAKTIQVLEGGVRVTQYKPNVVRIVIQTPSASDVSKISSDPTKNSLIELAEAETDDSTGKAGPPIPLDTKGTPLVSTAADMPGAQQTPPTPQYLPLSLDRDDAHASLLSIHLPNLKNPAQFKKSDPSTLEIVIPGVFLELSPDFKLQTDIVSMVRSEKTPTGTLVTLFLTRPVGAEVSTEPTGVSIQLLKPNVGDGKLAGKVIVVDPGHGGTDPGAKDAGFNEKAITLEIGKLLGAELAAEGATVIMTRKTDVFIPLMTRSDIANQSHADLFISCHVNDSGGPRNMTGTITFHHKGNAISRVLAECIQNEIAKVSGIPNTGVWSDGKIYPQGGFSVLRNTKMTGVLIEFGFIDNSQDRKRLITDQFQQAVAKAVVRGVKVYLGDAKRTKNSPSGKGVFALLLVALLGAGALAAYVKFTPEAARVTVDRRANDPEVTVKSTPEVAPFKPARAQATTLLIPAIQNNDVQLATPAPIPPEGVRPEVNLLNLTLRSLKIDEARAIGIEINNHVAMVDFNPGIQKGYGSIEEGYLIKSLQMALGQFPDVEKFQVRVEGKPIDSLGNIDLSNPIPVIRPGQPQPTDTPDSPKKPGPE